MRRAAFVLVAVLCLVFVPALKAQKKPKDEVLQQYLVEQFGQLNTKLGQLEDHLKAVDTELNQVKQKQNDLDAELRDSQTVSKSIDTSLSSFRLSSQQDLLNVKTDLAQTRQDLAALADLIKKSSAVAAAPPKPPDSSPAPAALEGYVTAIDGNQVTINLGSSVGVKEGAQFNVYKSADPSTAIGVAEVTQVIDSNNSRARIIFSKPGIQFEFSDIVRLK